MVSIPAFNPILNDAVFIDNFWVEYQCLFYMMYSHSIFGACKPVKFSPLYSVIVLIYNQLMSSFLHPPEVQGDMAFKTDSFLQ